MLGSIKPVVTLDLSLIKKVAHPFLPPCLPQRREIKFREGVAQRVQVPNNQVDGIWLTIIIAQVFGKYMIIRYPDPLKDPTNGTPQDDTHYYIGETRRLLGGAILWIL